MRHLFTITDSFQIEGLGCVVVPGLSPDESEVRTGSRVRLKTPGGKEIDTVIKGIEFIRMKSIEKMCFPISLPANLKAGDVPSGTEVFLAD